MDTVLKQYEPSELTVLQQPHIINELTNIIYEWGALWKQLYVSGNQHFEVIEGYIKILIEYRALLKHYKILPVDQLKVTQKLATLYINLGNKLLGLDMIVWDEHSNKLNPLHTPTFKIYNCLKTSTKYIQDFDIFEMFKNSISESNNKCNKYVYIPIRHENKQSLLRNVDYVKKIEDQQWISPRNLKIDLDLMWTRGKIAKGIELLNFLNWKSCPEKLIKSLFILKKLNVDELIMFLRDVLDALFNIFTHDPNSYLFDNTVFDCLLYIIEFIPNKNDHDFHQVLNLYINKYFCCEVAYVKLMTVLKLYLSRSDPTSNDNLSRTVKSFNYIMKFITISKLLSTESMRDDQIFAESMIEIFKLLSNLMYRINSSMENESLICACLECVPLSISDVITVFSPIQLSLLLVELIRNSPRNMLVQQKLNTMSNIVHSQLFSNADCQDILIPFILDEILMYMNNTAYISLCAYLLSNILEQLHATADSESKFNNITKVMLTCLNIFVQVLIKVMNLENCLVRCVVSSIISILRQMTYQHFKIYTTHFKSKADMLDFLKNILIVFQYLVSNSVFPKTWNEMIMIQNCVILKSLRYFSETICNCFLKDMDYELWKSFFHCTFIFMMQPSLQLEKFSFNKRLRNLHMYNDLRMKAKTLIWTMWSYLGNHEMYFMPDMVGSFLEISLIPDYELRKTVIPIFFELMKCEFYSFANDNANTENSTIKGEFSVFQNKMIINLDRLIVNGRGDQQFKELFRSILKTCCENHPPMRDQGLRFIEIITYLLECLLNYQISINDENEDKKLHCIVNLLKFYKDIQHLELIVKYVNQLYPLHLKRKRFIEAAYTLKVHSELLLWSNNVLPIMLRSPLYPSSETHSQLKEALYKDIINNFDEGEMWECAIIMCKELVNQYESEIYNYAYLSDFLRKMSEFYDKISEKVRRNPNYFRIAYYGKGFPSYLQNKVFIHRGNEYVNKTNVTTWIEDQFPDATIMKTLSQPGPEITESFNQFIQINGVEPIMAEHNEYFSLKVISEEILQYYRVNQVKKFKFSRKTNRVDPILSVISQNKSIKCWTEVTVVETAYSLPDIVPWSLVKNSHTYEQSPLSNAIEDMKKKNDELRESIKYHKTDPKCETLSRTLNGILISTVHGGISMYEQAFFTPEYLINHKKEEGLINSLKELIAYQIPLVEDALKLLENKAPLTMSQMIKEMEKKFVDLRNRFEVYYGKKIMSNNSSNDNLRKFASSKSIFKQNKYANSNTGTTGSQNCTRQSYLKMTSMTATSKSEPSKVNKNVRRSKSSNLNHEFKTL